MFWTQSKRSGKKRSEIKLQYTKKKNQLKINHTECNDDKSKVLHFSKGETPSKLVNTDCRRKRFKNKMSFQSTIHIISDFLATRRNKQSKQKSASLYWRNGLKQKKTSHFYTTVLITCHLPVAKRSRGKRSLIPSQVGKTIYLNESKLSNFTKVFLKNYFH